MEPAQNEQASQIVFVPKKEESLPFFVYYRKRNAIKICDSHHTTKMYSFIDLLGDIMIIPTSMPIFASGKIKMREEIEKNSIYVPSWMIRVHPCHFDFAICHEPSNEDWMSKIHSLNGRHPYFILNIVISSCDRDELISHESMVL